jgi:hypothetical protein
MNGQLVKMIGPERHHLPDKYDCHEHSSQRRERLQTAIMAHQALSRRGLWGILFFLALSIATVYCRELVLTVTLPENVLALLGTPPPAILMHIALAISCLSSLVLIFGRRPEPGTSGYNWMNVAMPTLFYPVYFFTEGMDSYFPIVFAAGLFILLVEHITIGRHNARIIREERELLQHLPGGR